MGNDISLVLKIRSEGDKVFVQVADQVVQLGDAVAKTDAKLKSASAGVKAYGESFDQMAGRSRVALANVTQLGDVAGLNLSKIIGPAVQATDAVQDLAEAFKGLKGMDMLVSGLATGGIAALALFVQYTKEMHDASVVAIETNDKFYQSLRKLSEGSAEVAAQIHLLAEAQVSLSGLQSLNPIEGFISGLNIAKIQMDDFIRSIKEGHPQLRTIAQIMAEVNTQLREMTFASGAAGAAFKTLTGLASANVGIDENALAVTTAWEQRERALTAEFWRLNPAMRTAGQTLDQFNAKGDKATETARRLAEQGLEKARAAAERAAAAFRSMVEGALSPTAADPEMGNAWDEARKRFEAFASGTDTGAYGDKFKKMFEDLGMSAKDAAAAFKDFSLFADPKNINLVDFGPVVADVERQLLGMAGKANVVKEAMKQVWANLSPAAKSALAEQGIGDAEEAITQMVNPAEAAKKEVLGLSAAVTGIPTMVTTVFKADIESAKSAVQELADFLDEFINAYGTVNVSAQGDFSGPPPPPDGSNNNGSSGGRATGGYVGRGMYRLGEAGKEYVLPHGLVTYIEKILGGKITNPDQIGWLVGALGGGAGEAKWALGNWASGMAGWGVDAPANADKWTKKIYDRYAKTYGADALPASVSAAAAGGGGGDGGGSIDLSQTNALLESIDRKLGAILGNMGRGGDMLALGAQLRFAQGLT